MSYSQLRASSPRRIRVFGITFSGGYSSSAPRDRNELIEQKVRELSAGDMSESERDRIRNLVVADVDRNSSGL